MVTTEQPENVAAGRQQILGLISLAGRHAARGIAFDFHIQAVTTRLDPLLCREARRAGIPVVFGYRMEEGATGRWRPWPL